MEHNWIEVRITRKTLEAENVALFELAAVGWDDLPSFSAGSHIDVEIAPGLTRQYSLCNHPGEHHRYLIGVLQEAESRGGSIAMHALGVGDKVRISPPRNNFALVPGDHHSLLLAGGIGITPILCMAERLAHIQAPFALHYASRSIDRMAFRRRMAESSFADRLHFHVDDGPPEQRLDLAGAIANLAPGAHVYVCGPPGFIAAVQSAAEKAGLPSARFHREHFTPPEPVALAPAGSFQITLASTGRVIDVPADQTVVEALLAHGTEIETSCAQGVCGTCLTRVLRGTPDHRDYYLSEEEQAKNDVFLPCCSRSLSPMLVLDL